MSGIHRWGAGLPINWSECIPMMAGSPLMVLTHIEVQGAFERDFAERIYVYNYRIYDKFRCPVVSLAVLTDESPAWRSVSFGYKRWGFRLEMEFPMTKLLDYNDERKVIQKRSIHGSM